MSTETDLREWRNGPLVAERLCAAILSIEGYTDIDPQAPLGGPDGRKDILCRRNQERYVAAVYFPPTEKSLNDIERKFRDDFEGVAANNAKGFVFFTNQHLTVGERVGLLGDRNEIDEIFHLERLRAVLDAPAGYGLRLEYLGRAMTAEEQLAFFSVYNPKPPRDLLDPRGSVHGKLDDLLQQTASILHGLGLAGGATAIDQAFGAVEQPTSDLTVADLLLMHSAVMADSGSESFSGQFRTVRVWVGPSESPIYIPPLPEEVPSLLADVVLRWRANYIELAKEHARNRCWRASRDSITAFCMFTHLSTGMDASQES